jgi:pSer/pThr/pTyr-binding forkhead associated (FHA) protein
VQKRPNIPEFFCPKHADIRNGKEGASLAVPSYQSGIKGFERPSYADLIKARPNVYSEKGGEVFIELNNNSVQAIGRHGDPREREGLSPTYLTVVPAANGAPCNVSLKHADIVWNGNNWVFTTLKTHQGAAWVLRSYNEKFENPTDFILINGDVIRMGNHGYYITLVFYEV